MVTYLDAVCRQEENALEVLQLPKEDADQRVAVEVVHVAFLEEHIGLIQ